MLTFSASEQSEKIRQEIRAWLKDNPPPEVASETSLETFVQVGKQWQKKLAASRFIAVHWPQQYGGRGLSLVEEAIIQEELGRARAPQVLGLFGLTMVGPVLIKYGREDQKSRYLQKILNCDEIWCQGFSEPEAGSDLVNVKTKALKVDGGFKISGQKVWTSFAHIADHIFVLARTSDEEKKHKGLTYFLVPMTSSGITVRPLRQITGDAEFNEVFFEDVFVPEDAIVGQIGDGWNIAISTLMYERLVLTFSRHIQSEHVLRGLLQKKDQLDPQLQVELGKELSRATAVRALAYKHLTKYANGESPGAEGSLDKLFWTTSFQSISKLALKASGIMSAFGESDPEFGTDVNRYLYSRGRSIAAGTSEIQRGIIAERLLGLPKGR
jgi:alkylation response protein AidB-like acyl-CoA dehydrogenase